MDTAARQVLARYPGVLTAGRLEPLGGHGGFSGARLWRLHSSAGPLCLRAAAPAETAAHLTARHGLMRRARSAGLAFVPAVLPTVEQATAVEAVGRLWELLEWLPGVADYHAAPSEARLCAAVRAVAHVHRAWAEGQTHGACPAVLRRREAVHQWEGQAAGFIPAGVNPAARLVIECARRLLDHWMPRVEATLPAALVCRVQPCLRDVWHDHLLFEGDRLTGLVDYAAVGMDSVATDLARLLGSLVEDDEDGWRVGLRAYREVAALTADEERLARLLDRTGIIVAVFHWLCRRDRLHDAATTRRLETLLRRVEAW